MVRAFTPLATYRTCVYIGDQPRPERHDVQWHLSIWDLLYVSKYCYVDLRLAELYSTVALTPKLLAYRIVYPQFVLSS